MEHIEKGESAEETAREECEKLAEYLNGNGFVLAGEDDMYAPYFVRDGDDSRYVVEWSDDGKWEVENY